MGLLVDYSKQVARELTKIPVVLPGEEVKVGDILCFPEGQEYVFPVFHKHRPLGSFMRIVNIIEDLEIACKTEEDKENLDTYLFASSRDVSFNLDLGGSANPAGAGSVASVQGKLSVAFKKKGAIYFAAVDCYRKQICDMGPVQEGLRAITRRIYTKDTFLVSSVTIASRALIMMSASESASLSIGGEVQGLCPGAGTKVSAKANLSVGEVKDAFFFKPWSENVAVFFGLWWIEKLRSEMAVTTLARGNEARTYAHDLLMSDQDEYALRKVSPLDLAATA